MLTANVKDSEQAVDAECVRRSDGPFACPECDGEVVLKRGRIVVAHFAHKPPFDCYYGTGETRQHHFVKRAIYAILSRRSGLKKVGLELSVRGLARPDVRFVVGGHFVAVEIQRSPLPPEEITKRTTRYRELGVHVLWVVAETPPPHGYVITAPAWMKHLHGLYFGRIYFWIRDSLFLPVHLGPAYRYVEEFESRETGPVGGYYRRLKSKKTVIYGVPLHIEEFSADHREGTMLNSTHYPDALLWTDSQGQFWKKPGWYPDPYEGPYLTFHSIERPGKVREPHYQQKDRRGYEDYPASCGDDTCEECELSS